MLKVAFLSVLLATAQTFASESTGTAAKAINSLGIELLAKISKPDQNALFSPYSIQSALAMTYAGADGVTRAEMARVLHYPGEGHAVARLVRGDANSTRRGDSKKQNEFRGNKAAWSDE